MMQQAIREFRCGTPYGLHILYDQMFSSLCRYQRSSCAFLCLNRLFGLQIRNTASVLDFYTGALTRMFKKFRTDNKSSYESNRRGGPATWPDLAVQISAQGPFTVLSMGAGSTEGHCHTKTINIAGTLGREKVDRGTVAKSQDGQVKRREQSWQGSYPWRTLCCGGEIRPT